MLTESQNSSAANPSPIRVFILSNQDIYVHGLRMILEDQADIQVEVCQSSAEACLEQFRSLDASVMLVNRKVLPDNLNAFFQLFRDVNPEVKILVFGSEVDHQEMRDLLRAGVNGYLNDTISSELLVKAVRDVRNDMLWVERSLLGKLVVDSFEFERMLEMNIRQRVQSLREDLSEREIEVLQTILAGQSTRDAAEALCLSEQSVKLYLNRLFRKFGVANRSQLILVALERVCPVQMVGLMRDSLGSAMANCGLASALRS